MCCRQMPTLMVVLVHIFQPDGKAGNGTGGEKRAKQQGWKKSLIVDSSICFFLFSGFCASVFPAGDNDGVVRVVELL